MSFRKINKNKHGRSLALVLSGGFVKGAGHIGMVQVAGAKNPFKRKDMKVAHIGRAKTNAFEIIHLGISK